MDSVDPASATAPFTNSMIDVSTYIYTYSQGCLGRFVEMYANRAYGAHDGTIYRFGTENCECIIDLITYEFTCGGTCKTRCDLSDFKDFVIRYVYQSNTIEIRELNYTHCIGDKINSLCLVPIYLRHMPFLILVRRKNGDVGLSMAPFYHVDGVLYTVGRTASLVGAIDRIEYRRLKLSKLSDPRYLLAALPYVIPHFKKRKIPVVIGPMRSGKTHAVMELVAYWPQPVAILNSPSFASLRNAISASHTVADDYGESFYTITDWSVLIAYHDRTAYARVVPSTLKTKYFYPRGTLVVTTNNLTARTANILDRIRLISVDAIRDGGRYDVRELESWLSLPYVYINETDVAGIYGSEDVFAMSPHIDNDVKLSTDPWVYVYSILLNMLYKHRAEGNNFSRNVKLIEGRECLCISLNHFNNPLGPDTAQVTTSKSKDIYNKVTWTSSVTKTKVYYSAAFMRKILEPTHYFRLVLYKHNNYYVCVDLENIEPAVQILEGLVQKRQKGLGQFV